MPGGGAVGELLGSSQEAVSQSVTQSSKMVRDLGS